MHKIINLFNPDLPRTLFFCRQYFCDKLDLLYIIDFYYFLFYYFIYFYLFLPIIKYLYTSILLIL